MSFLKKKPNEESELEEIRKGFEMFDVNGTGKIIPLEVKEAMDSMNIKEKNPFIYEVIESLCSEKQYRNNNGITIEDLVNYVYDKVNDNETNLGLRQLFDALKDPESDTISMHTFIKLAKDYGDDEGISEDELRNLLEKTQLGGDELTFDEFYTIMKGGGSSSSKSNISIRSSEAYNKKKQSPLSNITSQDNYVTSKKDEENDNVNYNEEEINIDNMRTPDKSISIIKNSSNINMTNMNMDLESFEKGINPIKLEAQMEQKNEEKPPQLENNVNNVNNNIQVVENVQVKQVENNSPNVQKEQIIVKEEKIEKKDERPIKKYKYNRFRKADNSNNNNIDNNSDKNNKIVVEEKTTVVKSVYRTRRPVNLNNEDKKDEKKNENNEDKKDVEIPRRYHRRYRENKISTNVGQ